MDLRSTKFLILDCQTTGMRPSVGSLLELCWAAGTSLCESIEIGGGLVQLPEDEEIPARVREITGIKKSDLKEARSVDEIRAEFLVAVQRLSEASRPVALIHYAQFEEAWLRDLLGVEELPFDILCTHRISKRLFPTVPSRNIRGLTGYFGMRIGEIKRAHQHVEATQKIWSGIVPALAAQGIATVEDVRAFLSEKPAKKVTDKKVRAPSYEYRVDREKRLALPEKPGIYKMIAKSGEILYVGKATSLKDRVNSYFRGKKGRDPRKLEMMAQVWDLEVVECESAIEAALIESDEIKRLNPPYNVSLKEGQRSLLYYNRDLTTESLVQSSDHPVGPFRRFNSVEHLRLFAEGLREDLVRNVFYQPIESRVLEDGYALFEEKYGDLSMKSVRDHLAFGMKLLRVNALLKEAGSDVESDVEPEVDSGVDPGEETLAGDVTPVEILEKLEHMYMRAASTYLRAKDITKLLWADVRWFEKGEAKALKVRGGRLIPENAPEPERRPEPWCGLAISDYDRMSVLLMEISKVDHEIEAVR